MVNLDEFVTIKQAARLLHVSANTLRNWHRDAKIPSTAILCASCRINVLM